MTLRSSRPLLRALNLRNLLGASAAVALASSCSLAYDLSPDQCSTNSDCAKFGAAFTCNAGLCVDRTPSSGGTTSTGGKTSAGGKVNVGGAGGDAGGDSGGAPSSGGMESLGGMTGQGGTTVAPPECATHNDCFEEHGDAEPWACIEQKCVELWSEECPLILPTDDLSFDALRSTDAIIIGAFAETAVPDNPQVENYDLALGQIAAETGGIPASGAPRQVVAVVCTSIHDTQAELLKPVDHLIDTLKVPAILAAVGTADQQYIFQNRTRDADVFMMVPIETDDTVVNLPDKGLIYHMLSGPDMLSETYQPLVNMTITHLQHQGKLGTGPDYQDVRIGLVTADDDRFLTDLGADFEANVNWNGKTAAENADAEPRTFVSVGEKSEPAMQDRTAVADAILGLAPHIVVGAAGNEMTLDIIQGIERKWDDDSARKTQGRPFYILSPFNYNGSRSALLGEFPSVRTRLLGLNWPATLQEPAYSAYKSAYQKRYPGRPYFDYENFYDSVYFLLYGMVGAGPQIRGETIAKGMTRITSAGDMAFDVGIAKVGAGFGYLSADVRRKIDLTGANGKPNWDLGGGRATRASVWCLGSDQGTFPFRPDALRFDNETGTLTGALPADCFTFPAPAP